MTLEKKFVDVNIQTLDPELNVPPPPKIEMRNIDGSPVDPSEVPEEIDMQEYRKKNWDMWCRISIANFGFKNRFELRNRVRVSEGDILFHKLKLEAEMYPQVHYFIIVDGTPNKIVKKDAENKMGTRLIEYVNEFHRLPYSCKLEDKFYKNGNVKIIYTPTKWDEFPIVISKEKGERYNIEDLHEFFNDLDTEKDNPSQQPVPKNKIAR